MGAMMGPLMSDAALEAYGEAVRIAPDRALPLVGIGTAIAFAVSIAAGVATGARDIKSGNYPSLPRA